MGKLFIANEVIDFQTTMFGKELEGVFTSIKGKYVTSDAASKATETKVFEAIIKKYTNLNVDFKLKTQSINNYYLVGMDKDTIIACFTDFWAAYCAPQSLLVNK